MVVVKVGLSPKVQKVPSRASGWAPEFHSLTHSLCAQVPAGDSAHNVHGDGQALCTATFVTERACACSNYFTKQVQKNVNLGC